MIDIQKPGFLSLIQDVGRTAYIDCGVPVSGVMDEDACRLANWLVGNELDAPVIETTLIGPQIFFKTDAFIGITGADMSPTIDGFSVDMNKTLKVDAGSVLKFGPLKTGCRAYISFAGGIVVSKELGSTSTYEYAKLGGLEGMALKKGDSILLGVSNLSEIRTVPNKFCSFISRVISLRILPGIEHSLFDDVALDSFYRTEYRVASNSNRMGYRLEGSSLPITNTSEMFSSGIVRGTIQVPASGQPIVLLSDAQTTGGYPRIANVIKADLPLLAQQKPGDRIRFRRVSLQEAQQLFKLKEERFSQLFKT